MGGRMSIRDLDDRRRDEAYARAEWRREVARSWAEEEEHHRILNDSLTLHRPLHHASVATDELARLEDGAAALVREREWDRLLECGE